MTWQDTIGHPEAEQPNPAFRRVRRDNINLIFIRWKDR